MGKMRERGREGEHTGLVFASSVSLTLGTAQSPHQVEDRVAGSDGWTEKMTWNEDEDSLYAERGV